MKKVFSVILLIVGLLFIYSAMLHVVIRGAGDASPDYAVVIVSLLLGAVSFWGGTKLWDRWLMPAGITTVLFGLSTIGNTAGYYAGTTQLDSEMVEVLKTTLPIIAVVWLALGIYLIVIAVKRRKAAVTTVNDE